jgi:hypothetical protein
MNCNVLNVMPALRKRDIALAAKMQSVPSLTTCNSHLQRGQIVSDQSRNSRELSPIPAYLERTGFVQLGTGKVGSVRAATHPTTAHYEVGISAALEPQNPA